MPCVLASWRDFGFAEVDVPAFSTAGTLYQRRIPFGMPKIPPQVLYSPFYLYNSVADAEAGRPFGGTGFFVGVPIYPGNTEEIFPYAVTNWHVAVRDGASVIRLNKIGGGVDIFDFGPEDWEFRPQWHDIAAMSFPHLKYGVHEAIAISTSMFLDPIEIAKLGIGSGEDVFMIGRFVDHDGAESNVPAARFGNISVMPQVVEQPTGAKNLGSFILDVHSRTGYSGSPVFVYRTIGADLTTDKPLRIGPDTHFIKLLGLHWGQFPEQWEIEAGTAATPQGVSLSGNEKYIRGLSGMTLAVPAWAITELLNMPKFRDDRARRLAESQRHSSASPLAESEPSTKADNPSHQEDFRRLVSAAARKKKRDD